MSETLVSPVVARPSGGATVRQDLTAEQRARVEQVVTPTRSFSKAERFEAMQGGAATNHQRFDADAFSQPHPNLSFKGRERFSLGNAIFRKLWVSSPSSTLMSDGLGPMFNARACQACHIKDGRGHLPALGEKASSLVVTLSHRAADGHWVADRVYGHQLQTFAVPTLRAEGDVEIRHVEKPLPFASGEEITLRRPLVSVTDLAFGALSGDTVLSARLAPSMIGMGLLEAIASEDILRQQDPDDLDGNGISGRVGWVVNDQTRAIGRFGYTATADSVTSQAAAAFSGDLGLSTSLRTSSVGDCTRAQHVCQEMPDGVQEHLSDHEVSDELLELVSFYSANLAPPQRRDVSDPNVLAGKKQFYQAGCTGCHTPKYVTSTRADFEQHRFQLIWPYTDLLLHDMGDGLADRTLDGEVSSRREWRTAPLWGVGMTETVNPRASFLHDGRARTLLEAVLWHGGEASDARDAVLEMTQAQRLDLVRFLESL